MPELPEVEAIARTLGPLVCGQTILRCRVFHPIAVRPQQSATLRAGIEGRRVVKVERRGKYLLLHLAGATAGGLPSPLPRVEQSTPTGGCVVMHFRLDGQVVWFDSRQPAGHIDVALELDEGTVGFVDRRHFGRVNWFARSEDSPGIEALGMDPLSPVFTARRLEALLSRSRRPLKLLLLDQTRIAGLGNIYSNEALWHARLRPQRLADRLTSREARRLHKAIVDVLQRALECCLDPPPDFRNPDWWFQGLEAILRVYGRAGERCHRCGARIRRVEQSGRSSYCCFGCQR